MQFFKKTTEELEALKSKLEAVEAENTELREDIAKAQEKDETIATLQNSAEEKDTEIANLNQKVEELKADLNEAQRSAEDFDNNVSKAAQEEMAGMGIEPVEETPDEEPLDVMEELKKLSGKELKEFYDANRSEILKHFGH